MQRERTASIAATCLVELSGPGQYQGVDSAGAERNWHVDVGILQRQRALQASLVDAVSVQERRVDQHRECTTDQRRIARSASACVTASRALRKDSFELAGHSLRERQRHQGLHEKGRVVLRVDECALEERGGVDEGVVVDADSRHQVEGDTAQQPGLQLIDGRLEQCAGAGGVACLEMVLGRADSARRLVPAERDGQLDQFGRGRAGAASARDVGGSVERFECFRGLRSTPPEPCAWPSARAGSRIRPGAGA